MPEMENALRIIIARSPDAARHAINTIRAIQARSPIVQDRYNRVVDLALSDPQATFTAEERAALAEFVTVSGSDTGTREYTLRVRLTDNERDDLEARAENAGQSLSQYVRGELGL